MCYRLFVAVIVFCLLHTRADAGEVPAIPFRDGRWHGAIKVSANSSDLKECWASTTFADGTTFTLAKRKDANWHLRLSNPGWRLSQPRQYAMVVLVDFYPRLRIKAEVKDQTLMEIADLEHISLLGLIENGHTIDLTSDGFNAKYELEGSAKVIQRIRNCFVDQVGDESAARVNAPLR